MEVPGSNDIICDFCFAMNPQGAHICEECGAPLVEGKEAGDESDQLVYRDLARANLQRMRGDFAAARETCLSILRRYPNNATTQGLLGDIYPRAARRYLPRTRRTRPGEGVVRHGPRRAPGR